MADKKPEKEIGSSLVADEPQNQMMSAKTFSAKFRSKREVWNFLSVSKLILFMYFSGWPLLISNI